MKQLKPQYPRTLKYVDKVERTKKNNCTAAQKSNWEKNQKRINIILWLSKETVSYNWVIQLIDKNKT